MNYALRSPRTGASNGRKRSLVVAGGLAFCVVAGASIPRRDQARIEPRDAPRTVTVANGAALPTDRRSPVEARTEQLFAAPPSSVGHEVEIRLVPKIRAALETNVKQAEYLQCLASSTTEHYCPSLYADAVLLAMGESGANAAAEALRAKIDALGPFDRAEARSAVAKVAESSSDELARIAALKVLSFETETEHPPLSEATYANLSSKPIVESMLLARRHILAAVPSAQIADDFATLAQSPDSRLRKWSLRALGHEETAEQLNRALSGPTLESTEAFGVARAVIACGARCLPTIDRMMEGSEREREAIYEMFTLAPPDSLNAIGQAIQGHPARDAHDSALRAEMFRNAGIELD